MKAWFAKTLRILPFILIGLGLGLAIDYNIQPVETKSHNTIATSPQSRALAASPTSPVIDVTESELKTLENSSRVFAAISNRVNPAVVAINTRKKVEAPGWGAYQDFFNDPFFRRFFQIPPEQELEQQFLGSGVIVTPDGYIITNNHVVADAEEITVNLASDDDNESHSAKLIGADEYTDVAVIKINGKNLPTITLGNSDEVKVGDWVLAIGNPFGLTHTVTAGIVSALGRRQILGMANAYEDFIQTDASINPGNSGGALVNIKGEQIGIPTAIATKVGQSAGVGFAIPINIAKNVMNQLIEHGRVIRGYLGVGIENISKSMADAMGLKSTEGVLVQKVYENTPAEKAGFKRGDVIIKVNGRKTPNVNVLRNMIANIQPGTKIKITIIRKGKERVLTAKLAEQTKEALASAGSVTEEKEDILGLSVEPLTPSLAERFGHGVIIRDVKTGGPGYKAGLRPGFIIKEMVIASKTYKIENLSDYERATSLLQPGDSVVLWVKPPRGSERYVAARIPKKEE